MNENRRLSVKILCTLFALTLVIRVTAIYGCGDTFTFMCGLDGPATYLIFFVFPFQLQWVEIYLLGAGLLTTDMHYPLAFFLDFVGCLFLSWVLSRAVSLKTAVMSYLGICFLCSLIAIGAYWFLVPRLI
jgi:hypothetical protein